MGELRSSERRPLSADSGKGAKSIFKCSDARSVRAQCRGRSAEAGAARFVDTFVRERKGHERYAAMADKKPMIEVTPGNLKWTGAPRARAAREREICLKRSCAEAEAKRGAPPLTLCR